MIIPTYNRKDILEKCLSALRGQDHEEGGYEIIIVDDGSSDGTGDMLDRSFSGTGLRIKYYRQDHKGPAAARNLGIKNAEGEIVLFLGDDIIASPDLLRQHRLCHERSRADNLAVLGVISWPPGSRLSPFLRWLETGPQFGYSLIKDPENASYRFFYSSNISLKKRFLLDHGLFDEDFHYAAYEDIELGYRLEKHGLRIRYNKEAQAYHEHDIYKANFLKRSDLAGRALKVFIEKHPELEDAYVRKARRSSLWLAPAFVLWSMPQWLAGMVPKIILYAGYSYMCTRRLLLGYEKSGN